MNGYEVKARRHARQIVQDMRWHDMTVPPLYGHMAREFQELVRSGEYAGWVAGNQPTTPVAGTLRRGRIARRPQPSRSRAPRMTGGPQPVWRGSLASRPY